MRPLTKRETMKKAQTEILKLRNTITELKNSPKECHIRLKQTEEIISKH